MTRIDCTLVVEDELSELVLRKTIAYSAPSLRPTSIRVTAGFGAMKRDLCAYNSAARSRPYIVLTDLDNTVCPSALIEDWFRGIHRQSGLLFHVAIREVESWVLADRQSVANLLRVQANLIPSDPDALPDPKQTIISLAKRPKRKDARQALIPIGNAKQGPDYNNFLGDFVSSSWQVPVAETLSPSLARAVARIRNFAEAPL